MHEVVRRAHDEHAPPLGSARRPAARSTSRTSLQDALGNQGMLHLRRKASPNALDLEVGVADHPAERSAETFADDLVARRTPSKQSSPCACGGRCAACAARKTAHQGPAQTATTRASVERATGSGQPLEPSVRHRLEDGSGEDLAAVRVHTGPEAARSADELGALAYSVGDDVVFGDAQYRPLSSDGLHLLAHEVGHILQQRASHRSIVRRQTPPGDPQASPAGAVDPSVSLFRVEVVSIDDYEASSGLSADMLPEGKMVSAVEAGLGGPLSFLLPSSQDKQQCSIYPGLGAGLRQTPMVSSPFPTNSMGILWEGSHLSVFSNVEGELTTFGFRAGLPRHAASAFERMFGWKTGPMTTSLNQGVPGSFANDAIFPYNPSSQALGRPVSAEEAAAFAETLRNRSYDQTYRFSPPPEGTPAFNKSFPSGVCPGGGTNCLNVPEAEILTATGGQPLVVKTPSGPLDIATGIGGNSRGLQNIGRASRMTEMMKQVPTVAAESGGLRRFPVGRAMLGRGAVGVIRVGGTVLMIYGAYKTFQHISEASPDQLPSVIGEEAGSWIGGIVGSAVGGAIGAGIVCSPTGPVSFACAVAGFVGGAIVGTGGAVAGAIIGKPVGEYVGDKAQEASDWLTRGIYSTYGVPYY
jgi:Domain of unknown function (DUF4157)